MRMAYRRLNQRIRRWFFSFDTPWRRRLYDRKRAVASLILPTEEEAQELQDINWTLGDGCIYDRLPAEVERAALKRLKEEQERGSDSGLNG